MSISRSSYSRYGKGTHYSNRSEGHSSESSTWFQSSHGNEQGSTNEVPEATCFSTNPEQRIATSFNITNLQSVISKFSQEKRSLVESIGFGSLLKLESHKKFPRTLSLWLLRNMDQRGNILLTNGSKLFFNDSDIHLVLGIPRGDISVKSVPLVTVTHVSKLREILLLNPSSDITIDCILEILSRDYDNSTSDSQRDAFIVSFMLYAEAVFMCPKGAKPKINQEMYRNLLRTDRISKMNWCAYVYKSIIESSKRVQYSLRNGYRTVNLDCCLLFLVVFYLDNLNFGSSTHQNLLPRFLAYPDSIVKVLEKADRQHSNVPGNTIYGRHKLLPDEQVLYSRNKISEQNKTADNVMEQSHNKLNYCEVKQKLDNWANQIKYITSLVQFDILRILMPSSDGCEVDVEMHSPVCETPTALNDHASGSTSKNPQNSSISQRQLVLQSFGHHDSDTSSYRKTNYQCFNEDLQLTINYDGEDPLTSSVDKIVTDSRFVYNFDFNTDTENDIDSSASTNTTLQSGPENLLSDVTWPDNETVNKLEEEIRKKLKDMGLDIKEGTHDTSNENADILEPDCNILVAKDSENQGFICYKGQFFNKLNIVVHDPDNTTSFGLSPFAIGLTHHDAPLEAQLAISSNLPVLSIEDINCIWYLHLVPNKIELDGQTMHSVFQGFFDFVPSIMNAVIRMYQDKDNEMYTNFPEKRWRHFLPSDFAVWALNVKLGGPSQRIEDMFLGDHIGYNVLECRIVLAPLLVHWSWCLYVWDFKRKMVVIFDPNSSLLPRNNIAEKHRSYLKLMHCGIKLSYQSFFSIDINDLEDWDTQFINLEEVQVDRYSSGLYTVFFARYFDGETITRILTKEATQLQRSNLMYQLLSTNGNIGNPPLCLLNEKCSYN